MLGTDLKKNCMYFPMYGLILSKMTMMMTQRSVLHSLAQKRGKPKTTMNARSHALAIIDAIARTFRTHARSPLGLSKPSKTVSLVAKMHTLSQDVGARSEDGSLVKILPVVMW